MIIDPRDARKVCSVRGAGTSSVPETRHREPEADLPSAPSARPGRSLSPLPGPWPLAPYDTMIVPLAGLFANALMALGSYGMAGPGLRQPRGLPRWLAASLIFWTASTLGLELLGSFGAIGTLPILAWSGLVAAIGSVIAWTRRGDAPEESAVAEEPAGWEATISLALVLTAALRFAIPSLLSAVKVVSDGPIYHLYFAARWWKAGRLILVAAPFGENAATYFPANGDLWFTWLMATWGGDTPREARPGPVLAPGRRGRLRLRAACSGSAARPPRSPPAGSSRACPCSFSRSSRTSTRSSWPATSWRPISSSVTRGRTAARRP